MPDEVEPVHGDGPGRGEPLEQVDQPAPVVGDAQPGVVADEHRRGAELGGQARGVRPAAAGGAQAPGVLVLAEPVDEHDDPRGRRRVRGAQVGRGWRDVLAAVADGHRHRERARLLLQPVAEDAVERGLHERAVG